MYIVSFYRPGAIDNPGEGFATSKMALWVLLEQAPTAEEYAYCDEKTSIRKRGWPVISG
jgi:hypothetical protein